MIRCVSGDSVFRSWSLPDRVSYRLDTEISPPYPKSWGARVFAKTFSEGDEESAGMRDSGIQHTEGSYTYGNDNSAELCSM